MGQLVAQARSLVKDGIKYSKSLTVEQKREVIVDWFQALPVQQQRQLLDELQQSFQLRAI